MDNKTSNFAVTLLKVINVCNATSDTNANPNIKGFAVVAAKVYNSNLCGDYI